MDIIPNRPLPGKDEYFSNGPDLSSVPRLASGGMSLGLIDGVSANYVPLEKIEVNMDKWPKPIHVDDLIEDLNEADIPLGLHLIGISSGQDDTRTLVVLKPELNSSRSYVHGNVFAPTGDGEIISYLGSTDKRSNKHCSLQDGAGKLQENIFSMNELFNRLVNGDLKIRYGTFDAPQTIMGGSWVTKEVEINPSTLIYLQESKLLIARNLIHSPANTINALRTS